MKITLVKVGNQVINLEGMIRLERFEGLVIVYFPDREIHFTGAAAEYLWGMMYSEAKGLSDNNNEVRITWA